MLSTSGRILQRHVLYLGELNGCQQASWRKTVELFGQDQTAPQQASLFPESHLPEAQDSSIPNIGIRISQMRLERPRQWGACWLGCELWQQLGLDTFWREKLPPGRQGARWDQILQTLVLYRLIDPGSEWRRISQADTLINCYGIQHHFQHPAMNELPPAKAFMMIEPGPVTLVTTAVGRRKNVMTISWTMVMDFTPKLAFVTGLWNHSYQALVETGEGVIASPAYRTRLRPGEGG